MLSCKQPLNKGVIMKKRSAFEFTRHARGKLQMIASYREVTMKRVLEDSIDKEFRKIDFNVENELG